MPDQTGHDRRSQCRLLSLSAPTVVSQPPESPLSGGQQSAFSPLTRGGGGVQNGTRQSYPAVSPPVIPASPSVSPVCPFVNELVNIYNPRLRLGIQCRNSDSPSPHPSPTRGEGEIPKAKTLDPRLKMSRMTERRVPGIHHASQIS